jgi:hypothetical protein
MIGSGMPMSQSNAPFPNDIFSLHLMFQRRLQFARVPLVPCSTPFDLADAFVIAMAGSEIVGMKASLHPSKYIRSRGNGFRCAASMLKVGGGARRRLGECGGQAACRQRRVVVRQRRPVCLPTREMELRAVEMVSGSSVNSA